MDVQNITLDLSKTIMVGQIVRMGQEDRGGTTIRATILDNTAVPSLSGMTAEFCMRLPDGVHYVRDSSNCTVSGNVITYVVDEEHCCSVAGYTDEAYFNLISGSTTYSTTRFRVKVERSVTSGSTPGETYDSEINQAIQRANDAAEAAEEAAGGVTPLMGENTRGGAMLGDGLALTGEKLGVDPLTTAQIDTVVADGSLTSNKVLTGTRLTYLWSKLKQKFASLVNGAVAVSQGGTGKNSHTVNAVITGNGTSAVNNVSTASGALYATGSGDAATFGTLPIAQGGTGGTTALDARKNLAVPVDSSIAYVESTTAQANHAVGDYFMLGGVLMRTTAAIAAGETINASKATPATVQGQIDTLRDSVGWTMVEMFLPSTTVNENNGASVTSTLSVPSGYTPVSFKTINTQDPHCAIATFTLSGNSVNVYVRNVSSVSKTVSVFVRVVCLKTSANE